MRKLFRTATVIGVLTTAVVIALLIFGGVPVVDKIRSVQEWMASQGPKGAALYPLFYALCNILLLPAGILSVGGGFFFGLWWGFFLVLAGNVVGAAGAFLIGRGLGRKWFEQRMLRNPRWAALDAAIEREGWKIIMLSQIHPLFPTSLINYFYGITRISFWHCMLWIAVGQAPGLFLYAYLGTLAQLGVRLLEGETHPKLREYVVWIGGLLLTAVVLAGLIRVALRLLREMDEAGAANKRPDSGSSVKDSTQDF